MFERTCSGRTLLLVITSLVFLCLWLNKTIGELYLNRYICIDAFSKKLPDDEASVAIRPFPHFDPDLAIDKSYNNIYRTYYWWNLWKGDPVCEHYGVHFLKPGAYPHPGALVSYPGSGNSWVRSLVMAATGIYITSVYGNEATYFASVGDKTETLPSENGTSLLQKTHDFSIMTVYDETLLKNMTKTELHQFNGKGILIIRDPFKALISYRNFLYAGMAEMASEIEFRGEDWDAFVGSSIIGWEWLARVWIKGLKQGGVVYYESLVHDTRSELRRLIEMMGLNVDEGRFECVMRHTGDNVFKRANKSKIIDPYSISQKILILKAIDSVQLALKERHLDPLPVHQYELFKSLQKHFLH